MEKVKALWTKYQTWAVANPKSGQAVAFGAGVVIALLF